MPLTVAIAGRPNVGKSTLFNRLARKQLSLTDNTPGLTRDWREAPAALDGLSLTIIDTAGFEVGKAGSLHERMWLTTRQGVERADVCLFVIDGRAGVTATDRELAKKLRRFGKPIIVVVNKCDQGLEPAGLAEAQELRLGDPLAISAAHNEGMYDLAERLRAFAKPQDYVPDVVEELEAEEPEETGKEDYLKKPLHLAIAGRPNAGKSTLVNALLGEERMLTGPEPGLTRDAIPSQWIYQGRAIRLVDTAGMRKKANVHEDIEQMMVHETLRAIRLAHVVVLVVDAEQPLEGQDLAIAQHVADEGRALVVAVNKWDKVKSREAMLAALRKRLNSSLAQLPDVPCVPIAAIQREGLDKLMKAVFAVYDNWNKRVSTGKLNRWLETLLDHHSPPIVSGRRIKIRYVTQVKARPPTFTLFVNKPVDLPIDYVRFLTNGIREQFQISGVPIRWQLKKGSENPFARKEKKKN